MVVKLDLRIPGRDNYEESDRSYRHLAVFSMAALFFICAFVVYLLIGWKVLSMNSRKTELNSQIVSLTSKVDMVNLEFSKLTSANAKLENGIDFMLGDTPTVEFMSALFTIVPDGLAIDSLKMTNSDLTITGGASSEEAIVTFAANLASSNFVTRAPLPDIKRAAAGSAGKFTFTVQGKLAPLMDIIEKRTLPETARNDLSGDVRP
ncbi:MAG: PilN domain-containing protein [Synergistaceae bacterium]|nr:PilN domain-containing protein [Synergistaceae bacterium]